MRVSCLTDSAGSSWWRLAGVLGVGLALAFAVLASPVQAAPKRVALLVGVGQYPDWPQNVQLAGPEPDVVALRDVLIRRWGFAAGDIKTLINRQGTRANILAELAALKQRSSAGDEVLVYFSGHGTSALDANSRLPVPHGSGAFVPVDARPDPESLMRSLIIGRTDLVPLFSALEAGGRKLWVISDSCYSGQQVRSLQHGSDPDLRERTIPLVLGKPESELRADLTQAAAAPRAEPYPYRATAFLAASSEGERARDLSGRALLKTPTLDGKPHGAFTDALLRVLEGQIAGDLDGDGYLSLNEVHRATSDFMAQRAYGHTPQRLPAVAEDNNGLGNAPVLGARGVAAPPRQPGPEPLRLAAVGLPPRLSQALAAVPDTRLVGELTQAEFVLRVRQGRIDLLAASGDLLAQLPADNPARLTAQVRQLAWAKRLRLLAERHRRGTLAVDLDPPQFGGNFVIGSKIAFVVRPDKAATLVLLNINADGKVTVLYSYSAPEVRPLPGGQARFIPGEAEHLRIRVQEPVGMDLQFAFAFDEPPPGLERLLGTLDADPADPRLAALEGWLLARSGKFTFATSSLRTLEP